MGKGEIARYEQFLLFPQCFQKACFPGASKGVIVWEWVKPQNSFHQIPLSVYPSFSFLVLRNFFFYVFNSLPSFHVS